MNDKRTQTASRFATMLLVIFTAAIAFEGCLSRPLNTLETRTTFTARFKQTRSGVDKIDLLLMIDNSGSMADKQSILADAVPTLVEGLLNPPCVGGDNKPIATQPKSPADACPPGTAREFEAILDVHIGIISSSLGSHGTTTCRPNPSVLPTLSVDDRGHLISRTNADTPNVLVPTYEDHGFLAWDPAAVLMPAGDSDLAGTVDKLRNMVKGVGQQGCGFEASLESWYRFLVDPAPYDTISFDGAKTTVTGIDQVLLDERAEFLRPDSLVAILMLTDENDCSTREEGIYPGMTLGSNQMPRPRKECAKNPNDPCCAPCNFAPKECPADDTCAVPQLPAAEDPGNLRCFDQKRRYGLDFLYPIERYTKALTEPKIENRKKELVVNPLYPEDPDGKLNARIPEKGLVFIAGIVGVPWQDIARKGANGKPDLLAGLMTYAELETVDPVTKHSRWDVILGDPANYVDPLDPLMKESRTPRTPGVSPILDVALAPTDAMSSQANPVNGHEWNTDTAQDGKGNPLGDLQYACTFKLKAADQRDCATATTNCDCDGADMSGSQNPLCQDDVTGAYTQLQARAKGYPGIRHLSLLRSVKEQGIVASVCPAQVDDPSAKDYGYTPAIGAIIDKLKSKLSGQCLERPLNPTSDGQVKCVVIEAKKSEGGACCTGKARGPIAPEHEESRKEAAADPSAKGADCFCEIDQLTGEELRACQTNINPVPVNDQGQPVDGWCYVDLRTGEPKLVASCGSTEQQKIRFAGEGQPPPDAVTFITCYGELEDVK